MLRGFKSSALPLKTNPRFALNLFTNIFVISSWVAISNEYVYKETNITLVYWFYWPIFSLYPRALQLKMNIIIKKQKLENRVSIPVPLECKSSALPLELKSLVHWFYWPIFSLFPRELQISNEYNYKETGIGEFGIDPGDSRIQIDRSTTWANPLVHCFYWPIFSLFPRELQLAMNIIRKKEKLENPGYRSRCFADSNRALYHLN